MKIKKYYLIFLVFMLVSLFSAQGQVKVTPRNNNNSQRQVDEQLAREFYFTKDFEKAKDIYLKLYNDNNQINYFYSYIDCVIQLADYDLAEKSLKSFIKQNPNNWRAKVDLGYTYLLEKDTDRAAKYFNKLIKDVPSQRNIINEVGNIMRQRGLNDYAIALYNKGSQDSNLGYHFYMEKAITYQSMLDFTNSLENYLLYLDEEPSQYEMVKNRIRVMIMYDIDNSINDNIRMTLLKKRQENPDNEQYAELLMWFSLQMQDYDIALIQALALDRRNGDRDNDIIYLAEIARDNKQFDVAIDAYDYIVKKTDSGVFYIKAMVGLLELEYEKAISDNVQDVKVFENISLNIDKAFENIGFYKETVLLMTTQAKILAYKMNRVDDAIALLNRGIALQLDNNQKSLLKMELADIYLFKDEVWEATLLYSQIDKAMKEEPTGHEARFKNARLRYFIGEFEWSLASLNVLKSATSKLIANDAMTLALLITDNLEYDTVGLRRLAKADYYIYQKKYDLANQMLDSVNAYNPNEVSMPYLLFRKATMAMEQADYQLADSLYTRIYEGYADSYMADEALMFDGLLLENQLNDKEKAILCYEKLIDYYTASVYVAEARKRIRASRNE